MTRALDTRALDTRALDTSVFLCGLENIMDAQPWCRVKFGEACEEKFAGTPAIGAGEDTRRRSKLAPKVRIPAAEMVSMFAGNAISQGNLRTMLSERWQALKSSGVAGLRPDEHTIAC